MSQIPLYKLKKVYHLKKGIANVVSIESADNNIQTIFIDKFTKDPTITQFETHSPLGLEVLKYTAERLELQKNIKKWVRALDSGKYKQGKGRLQRGDTYCCLGVACKIFIPKDKQLIIDGELSGLLPSMQPNAPQWLKYISNYFVLKTGTLLSDLNDQEKFTFSEIATILELIYIHDILD